MAEHLYYLRTEYDRYGKRIDIYRTARGQIQEIWSIDQIEHINYDTKLLEATERRIKQQIRTEIAAAELQDVRALIDRRSREFQRQLGSVTDLRRLTARSEDEEVVF